MTTAKSPTESVTSARFRRPSAPHGTCPGRVSLLAAFMLASGCSGSDSPGATVSAGGTFGTGGGSQRAGTSSISGSSNIGTSTPTGGSIASGGALNTTSAMGGSSVTGGSVGAGGTRASGGQSNSGGAPSAGGTTSTGGAKLIGGMPGTGGLVSLGGSTPVAGSKATGGVSATGGTKDTGGTGVLGGSRATGGAGTTGGPKPTGGTAATGGSSNTGGSSSTDRCDVGVYDAANPPRVLALSGNLGAHDPSLIFQESNGTYYEYQTGLGAKTSNNLTSWSDASAPFKAPAWLQTAVPGVTDLWAPDISYFNGRYHLYYAGSTFGKNRSCIGHATRVSLNSGSWADQGSVICSNVGTTDNWNAIDPNVIVDTNGTPWLDFGSFWSGIKMIQLDQNGARAGADAPIGIADRPKNGGALEGPFIVRRCGYYYLFTSWDTCCKGVDSTYNMRVVRSTSVTGPYTDQAGTTATSGGGTLIAQGNGSTWAGPGGQSVMILGNKAYLVYHAYSITSNGAATLRIADLVWDSSGWPVPVGP